MRILLQIQEQFERIHLPSPKLHMDVAIALSSKGVTKQKRLASKV
jgi:hypothetical protein